MFQCAGCGLEIDMDEGVTVVPARVLSADTPEERQAWHPDCRRAELRKRTGQQARGNGRGRKRELQAVGDGDDEMETR